MNDVKMRSRDIPLGGGKGGIYNAAGLDPRAVYKHKAQTGSVINFPGSEPITNEDLLTLDVDILVPSALEHMITVENAAKISAKIIAEAANGPTTPEADDILYERGVQVIPDFLCNGGGVTVSYFEMVQNFNRYCWTEEEVHERPDEKMTAADNSALRGSEVQRKHATFCLRGCYRACRRGDGGSRVGIIPHLRVDRRILQVVSVFVSAASVYTHKIVEPGHHGRH